MVIHQCRKVSIMSEGLNKSAGDSHLFPVIFGTMALALSGFFLGPYPALACDGSNDRL